VVTPLLPSAGFGRFFGQNRKRPKPPCARSVVKSRFHTYLLTQTPRVRTPNFIFRQKFFSPLRHPPLTSRDRKRAILPLGLTNRGPEGVLPNSGSGGCHGSASSATRVFAGRAPVPPGRATRALAPYPPKSGGFWPHHLITICFLYPASPSTTARRTTSYDLCIIHAHRFPLSHFGT